VGDGDAPLFGIGLDTELTERGQAISDWLMDATIYRQGQPIVEHHRLLGNRANSDVWAKQIDEQLDHNTDLTALTEWMQDLERGGAFIRSYAFAPFIAASLHTVLTDLGML
jgi:hypothetical protein